MTSEYFEHVKEAEAADDYRVAVRFAGGTCGVFDCTAYMNDPFWACLKDVDFFRQVGLDHGVLTWPNGVDIAPEEVWQNAVREKNLV